GVFSSAIAIGAMTPDAVAAVQFLAGGRVAGETPDVALLGRAARRPYGGQEDAQARDECYQARVQSHVRVSAQSEVEIQYAEQAGRPHVVSRGERRSPCPDGRHLRMPAQSCAAEHDRVPTNTTRIRVDVAEVVRRRRVRL